MNTHVKSNRLSKASSESHPSGCHDCRQHRNALRSGEIRSVLTNHRPPVTRRLKAPPIPPRANSNTCHDCRQQRNALRPGEIRSTPTNHPPPPPPPPPPRSPEASSITPPVNSKIMKVRINTSATCTSNGSNEFDVEVETDELELAIMNGKMKLCQPRGFTNSARAYTGRQNILDERQKQASTQTGTHSQPEQCANNDTYTVMYHKNGSTASMTRQSATKPPPMTNLCTDQYQMVKKMLIMYYKPIIVFGLAILLYFLLAITVFPSEEEELMFTDDVCNLGKEFAKLAKKVWRRILKNFLRMLNEVIAFVQDRIP